MGAQQLLRSAFGRVRGHAGVVLEYQLHLATGNLAAVLLKVHARATLDLLTIRGVRTAQGQHHADLEGFGRQRGHTEIYRGAEYRVDFLPKTKVEIAVDDTIVEQVIEAITNVARTGKIGDGKIFVTQLSQAVRIRTGEVGAEAL